MAEIILREAIARGLREALDNDERVFIMGEDVGAYQGAYVVTKGFFEKYGPERIRDTPIAEGVMVGSGVGAAMAGMRPIVEIMTINFLLLGIDQVVNHATKLRYMSNGQLEVPLIIRTVTGGGAQLAATHSQSFEGWFASVPGIKVAVPSDPYDALGLFRSALDERDPVIFAEHALLYGFKGEVPDAHYKIPFGQAAVNREGKDITLVAYGRMVHIAQQAAKLFAEKGKQAEVIDVRTLRPLDLETIVKSVKKTNRCIVVEEVWETGGFGSWIAQSVQEAAFDDLDGPVGHIGGLDVPAPYNGVLEAAAIPDAKRVLQKAKELFGM